MGRPEADTEEASLSEGQLRIRIRAYRREEAWAAYVADELDGTSREAAKARRDAALAEARGDVDAATEASRKADELWERVRQPQQADDARSAWHAHT